jgi:hypothetical protein
VHGEFVIEVRRDGDPAPLLLSPMLGKLLVHESRMFHQAISEQGLPTRLSTDHDRMALR